MRIRWYTYIDIRTYYIYIYDIYVLIHVVNGARCYKHDLISSPTSFLSGVYKNAVWTWTFWEDGRERCFRTGGSFELIELNHVTLTHIQLWSSEMLLLNSMKYNTYKSYKLRHLGRLFAIPSNLWLSSLFRCIAVYIYIYDVSKSTQFKNENLRCFEYFYVQ